MTLTLKEVWIYKLYKKEYFKKTYYDCIYKTGKSISHSDSLKQTFSWIKQSFKATGDGGSSAYYTMGHGWKASYPETTGYLIPTLYAYSRITGDDEWKRLAIGAADWLLAIQAKEGGWQGLQVDTTCELRVFNTAMILDGLTAAYLNERDEKYLVAAKRGLMWAISKIDDDGVIRKNNFEQGGALDGLTVACLLKVAILISESERAEIMPRLIHALDAVCRLQTDNGWFNKSNFEESFKDTSLMHFLVYALDGLVTSSEITGNDKYYNVALKTAAVLLDKFEKNKMLSAFYNADWSTYFDVNSRRASICVTGYSQLALVFMKIFNKTKNKRYLDAAKRMIDTVASIGNIPFKNKGLCYGLPGSYPVYGNYQKFKFVNWAAKFHSDSVMMLLSIKE